MTLLDFDKCQRQRLERSHDGFVIEGVDAVVLILEQSQNSPSMRQKMAATFGISSFTSPRLDRFDSAKIAANSDSVPL